MTLDEIPLLGNHSIPDALKNLLDHPCPEYEDTAFTWITVSAVGNIRALSHPRDTTAVNTRPDPGLAVSDVEETFDETYEEPSAVGIPEASA